MASIDKAAIGFTIAIVVIGVAIAGYGADVQEAGPQTQTRTAPPPMMEEKPAVDPFAEKAAQVKEAQEQMEKSMEEQRDMVTGEEDSMITVTPPVVEDVPDMSGPTTVTVSMPEGTSVPGCEETNECFIPATVTINAGDTVSWVNDDTAAHTVTSGTPTGGPDGVFDSSLMMVAASWEHTFDDSGTYDYFCMVHPWMVGTVSVN